MRKTIKVLAHCKPTVSVGILQAPCIDPRMQLERPRVPRWDIMDQGQAEGIVESASKRGS